MRLEVCQGLGFAKGWHLWFLPQGCSSFQDNRQLPDGEDGLRFQVGSQVPRATPSRLDMPSLIRTKQSRLTAWSIFLTITAGPTFYLPLTHRPQGVEKRAVRVAVSRLLLDTGTQVQRH